MQQIEQSIERYLAAMDTADRTQSEVAEAKSCMVLPAGNVGAAKRHLEIAAGADFWDRTAGLGHRGTCWMGRVGLAQARLRAATSAPGCTFATEGLASGERRGRLRLIFIGFLVPWCADRSAFGRP